MDVSSAATCSSSGVTPVRTGSGPSGGKPLLGHTSGRGHDAGMTGTGAEPTAAAHEGPELALVEDLLREELSRGDAALGRTETKTSILLAVFSPVLSVGLAVLPRASTALAARVLFWAALTLLAVALLLLLWNVRPRLRGSGFAVYASMTDVELEQHFTRVAGDPGRWHRERLLVIARLGARKFAMLRTATHIVASALVVAVAAAVVATTAH